MDTQLRYGYVDTRSGQLHYAEAGCGETVVLLHSTPRSHDEFRELAAILAARFRVIAFDLPGFGASYRSDTPMTIPSLAAGVVAGLDGLGISRASMLGHHTGAYVAVEIAATRPELVIAVVASAAKLRNPAGGRPSSGSSLDAVEIVADGSHLLDLWNMRRPMYPPGHPEYLNRYVRDALAPDLDPTAGHLACWDYRDSLMVQRAAEVTAPVLLLAPQRDESVRGAEATLAAAFERSSLVRSEGISDGWVPVMESRPATVASIVTDFLGTE